MPRSAWHVLWILATFAIFLPAPARAAGLAAIEPELAAAVAAAPPGGMIDVLIVLDPPAGPEREAIWGRVRAARAEERRGLLRAELRQRLAGRLAGALEALESARAAGRAERPRHLWLAGAVACRIGPEMVAALAAGTREATLLLDRPYEMLGRARERAAAAGPTGAPGLPNAPAAADTAWSVKWIKADRVWAETGLNGNGILVAHLDTGVWLAHPDLAGRLSVNAGEVAGNGLDDDGNGYADDVSGWDFADRDANPNDDAAGANGHGTHTAGTVCGDGTGGTLTGCAPGARLLVCKVFRADGSGAPFGAIWEARQYAVERGARVLTMSAGLGGAMPASLLRTERLTGDAMREAGLAVFNSAGNDHFNFDPPDEIGVTGRAPAPWHPVPGVPYSSLGGVVTVGGTGYKVNTAYGSSSQGPVEWSEVSPWHDWSYLPGNGLTKPDLAAPGTNVNSTVPPAGYSGDTWSGTSMACPHAAGVAALMLQKNPSLSPAGVDSILELTALDLGTAGKDNVFGSGLIDARAAVAAVPLGFRPLLVWRRTAFDPTGDNALDGGETADLQIELVNNSPVAAATAITGTLFVWGNPYVTVVDGAASWPNLLPHGVAAFNATNPFRLAASAGAPAGYEVRAQLTVAAAGGWGQTFDLRLTVGNPRFRTHDLGSVFLTVTDQGILGYMSDAQTEGMGFGEDFAGLSDVYLGSFWGGTGNAYICNRDYTGSGDGVENHEWIGNSSPGGRVRELAASGAQVFSTIFTDGGHPHPAPLIVNLTTRARGGDLDGDYVLLSYTVTNQGTGTLLDYHAGLFCDFDIGTFDTNEGGSDPARHLTWMRGDTGAWCGIALISPAAHKNLTLIHNPTYTYTYNAILNDAKVDFLKGAVSLPASTGPADWAALTSAGGFDLGPSQSRTFLFALLRARSLAGLQQTADRAALLSLTDVAETPPEPVLAAAAALPPTRPNPFNPRTEVRFFLPQPQAVRLEVHDLAGRLVRVLLAGDLAAGDHVRAWDGCDGDGAACPSGLYVVRLRVGQETLSRKMTLLR